MSKMILAGLVLGVGLITTACGGGQKEALQSGSAAPASEAQLRQLLLDDLAARGIDPEKAPSKAPSGSTSPTLLYLLQMGSGEPEPATPQPISFYVVTMIAGDCDSNALVNISDISRLAYWMNSGFTEALYADPAEVNGQSYFPANPQAYSDGDRNGLVSISDISPIGQHYGETFNGWYVYVKFPADSDFQLLMDRENPSAPYFIERRPGNVFGSGAFGVTEKGATHFYLAPVDLRTGDEGTPSRTFTFVSNELPTASFTVSTTEPTTADTVVLDGTGSSDSDGSIGSYLWTIHRDGQHVNQEYALKTVDDLVAEVRFFKAGTYEISLQVTDDRGGSGDSEPQTIQVTVGGERNPAWQFSEALDLSEGTGGTSTDLQQIAGRAALVTFGMGSPSFTSSPPDGSAWTTPVLPLPNPDFATVGAALAEVDGQPAMSAVHFYSVGNLNGGAPLEYSRALNPEGTAWGTPVVLGNNLFSEGLMEVGGAPYIFSTNYPFSSGFALWTGSDPAGSDLAIGPTYTFTSGEFDGFEFALRSSGSDHYVVNRDKLYSEVFHSDDVQTWSKVATVPNLLKTGDPFTGVASNAYVIDGRLALVWNFEGNLYFTMSLDAAATQWLPVKFVTGDALKLGPHSTTNPGSDNDIVGLAYVDGVPAIAYADGEYRLKLIKATNSNGTSWDSAGAEVLSSYGNLRDCDLAIIGGQPAVTVHNYSTGKIEYARRL